MIAYIEGRLAEVCANACVVVTEGGVGYEVYLPQQTRLQLPERGGHVRFYICHIVREDAQELFGFETWDERQTFIVLTSISKVGARTALGILSAFRPDDLRRLVLEDDVLALTQVSAGRARKRLPRRADGSRRAWLCRSRSRTRFEEYPARGA